MLTLRSATGARLERAAEAFWITCIVSVLLLCFAVAGLGGPLVQESAQELLLAPVQTVEQGWDLLRRIDWSYGLRRSF